MEGKVVRLIPDKGYGFIKLGSDDYFFHRSGFVGHWDDLVNDFSSTNPIPVTFELEKSPKGLRAKSVARTDYPNQA